MRGVSVSDCKIRIAVRMKDGIRRLYVCDHIGQSNEEIRKIALQRIPGSVTVLVELPTGFSPDTSLKAA